LDTTKFSKYDSSGVVENVKMNRTATYHSYAESVQNPGASSDSYFLMPTNQAGAFDRPGQIHVAMRAVHAFHAAKGSYPEDKDEDIDECVKLAAGLKGEIVEELSEKVVRRVARFSRRSLSPLCALFGGMIGQEVIKSTGKYTPLKQWLHHDIFQTLPADEGCNRMPKGCRYDD
jgi:ubiquitin-activating enzyme E1